MKLISNIIEYLNNQFKKNINLSFDYKVQIKMFFDFIIYFNILFKDIMQGEKYESDDVGTFLKEEYIDTSLQLDIYTTPLVKCIIKNFNNLGMHNIKFTDSTPIEDLNKDLFTIFYDNISNILIYDYINDAISYINKYIKIDLSILFNYDPFIISFIKKLETTLLEISDNIKFSAKKYLKYKLKYIKLQKLLY